MHFVIYVFIALICLITAVLFTEVFPKWSKALLALIGAGTTGCALSILIRKIAIWSNAFAQPKLWSTAGICSVIVLVVIIIAVTMSNKKKAK